jgi:serine O-acetyltransferase
LEQQGIRAIPEDLRFGFSDAGADASLRQALPKLMFSLRGQAVVLFRLSQSAQRLLPFLAGPIRYFNQVLTGADISPEASVDPGLRLIHPVGVVIGARCRLGRRCTIMQGVTIGAGRGESPRLGERVYVGPGAKLIGGIEIGSYAAIGANAVAIRDVPPRAFAAGIPAEVRREALHAAGP